MFFQDHAFAFGKNSPSIEWSQKDSSPDNMEFTYHHFDLDYDKATMARMNVKQNEFQDFRNIVYSQYSPTKVTEFISYTYNYASTYKRQKSGKIFSMMLEYKNESDVYIRRYLNAFDAIGNVGGLRAVFFTIAAFFLDDL